MEPLFFFHLELLPLLLKEEKEKRWSLVFVYCSVVADKRPEPARAHSLEAATQRGEWERIRIHHRMLEGESVTNCFVSV